MTLRWIAVAVTFLALLAAVAFGWRTQGLEGASWIFGIVGGLVALVMATAPLLRRDKQDLLPDESKVDTTHRRVAAHIARSIGSEAGTRRVDERLRIPLRLSVVSPPASDHWSNVTGPASERLDILLRGNLDISETFARAPTGRLVILGEPGSGKSTLLRTLAEDLLRRIRDTPPGSIAPRLPVLLDLRTWDPEATSFRDWFLDESVRAIRFSPPRTPAPVSDGRCFCWTREGCFLCSTTSTRCHRAPRPLRCPGCQAIRSSSAVRTAST